MAAQRRSRSAAKGPEGAPTILQASRHDAPARKVTPSNTGQNRATKLELQSVLTNTIVVTSDGQKAYLADFRNIYEKAYPSASGPAKCSDKRGVG